MRLGRAVDDRRLPEPGWSEPSLRTAGGGSPWPVPRRGRRRGRPGDRAGTDRARPAAPRAGCARGRAADGRRAHHQLGAPVRGGAQRAAPSRRPVPAGVHARGPALGRPVDPGACRPPRTQPHRRAGAAGRVVPHRRAAPPPPAAPGARRDPAHPHGDLDRARALLACRGGRAARGHPRRGPGVRDGRAHRRALERRAVLRGGARGVDRRDRSRPAGPAGAAPRPDRRAARRHPGGRARRRRRHGRWACARPGARFGHRVHGHRTGRPVAGRAVEPRAGRRRRRLRVPSRAHEGGGRVRPVARRAHRPPRGLRPGVHRRRRARRRRPGHRQPHRAPLAVRSRPPPGRGVVLEGGPGGRTCVRVRRVRRAPSTGARAVEPDRRAREGGGRRAGRGRHGGGAEPHAVL